MVSPTLECGRNLDSDTLPGKIHGLTTLDINCQQTINVKSGRYKLLKELLAVKL
jgi:hypothetical protein